MIQEEPYDEIVPAKQDDGSPKTTYKRLEGIILRVAAIGFFSITQILTKNLYIHSPISPLELIYFRGITMLICNFIYSKWISLDLLDVPKEQMKPMFYRSMAGTVGNMLFFTSTKLFPLSLVSAMSYLSPMMTAGLSFLVLHESLTRYDVASMLSAFGGVILIIFNPYKSSDISKVYDIKWWYYLCPIFNPIFAAIGTLLMRYMGKSIHCVVAPTFLAVFIGTFTPVLTLGFLSVKDMATRYDATVVIHILFIGMMGTLGQVLTSRALQIEKAGRVQAFNYLMVVFMLAADMFIFGIPIHWLDLVGIAIILGANVAVALLKAFGIIGN
eukprot:TRINITY_DN1515_c0_g3_i1.p1 TRINITY_DN1515_c0_g3~~TRINITY_DN1515_c0_g3_i1.p1  ORF type:complete len:328 (-),score=72.34 TRINITY_DN1515_c0_g3_i1:159-1142(-)